MSEHEMDVVGDDAPVERHGAKKRKLTAINEGEENKIEVVAPQPRPQPLSKLDQRAARQVWARNIRQSSPLREPSNSRIAIVAGTSLNLFNFDEKLLSVESCEQLQVSPTR